MKFYILEEEYNVKKGTEEEFIKTAIKDGKVKWLTESIEREIEAISMLKPLVISGIILVTNENGGAIEKEKYSKEMSKIIAANKKSLELIKKISTRLAQSKDE